MNKSYNPHDIEERQYERWERHGYFVPRGEGEPYCIMIPPPNVTGTLHMGHAFQDTIMDALIRYRRMLGDKVLWQPGTDHAGIATQMVVERQLNAEGRSRGELGRDNFVARVWQWKSESGDRIGRQMRRLGASVDWSRERFTMDDDLSAGVTEAFVRLYEDGLIYRGKRLVNWDPVLHTALSDLEVLPSEETGQLWHFRYPLADDESGAGIVVATTRPETMLGDSAVAVHPDDERYRHLVGRELILPLVNRRIPIIADEYVDPEFGSGSVKITPAHDFNDYEVGLRHNLPLHNIFDDDAAINDTAPPQYRGMDRFDAREKIVEDMHALALVERIDDHELKLPRGDRSGAVVEPYLTDQWYVNVEPLAKAAIQAVEAGRIRFVPENWSKTYFEWMHNIEDWCISRQLWWGHRIPAWYDNDGKLYVARSEEAARAKHGVPGDVPLRQDEDVLDTWFSSGLWPFSTLGWPGETGDLRTWYPGNVLVTGFDIIFFWVARMIMLGLRFMSDVPFREVYIHGLIRDQDGQKMSKSKGNVLDPLDLIDGIELDTLIEKRITGLMQPHLKPKIEAATRQQFPHGIAAHGADALRFTFAALATTGRDIRFELGRIEGYRKFCNKLWNAAHYVLLNTEGYATEPFEFSPADRWIRSRLNRAIRSVHEHFAIYRLDLAAQTLYDFTWHEFCDWYLELSKPVLQSPDSAAAAKQGARKTLIEVLETLLRLLHPIVPFITEEIWGGLAGRAGIDGETIMLQPFPSESSAWQDAEAEAELDWVMQFILGIRQIRGEMDLPPGKPLPVLLQRANESDRRRAGDHARLLERVGRIGSVRVLDANEKAPAAALALLGDLRLLVPMQDIIDVDAERARIVRQRRKLEADLIRSRGKLRNENFLNNAPATVVRTETERANGFERQIAQLDEQLAKLDTLEQDSARSDVSG